MFAGIVTHRGTVRRSARRSGELEIEVECAPVARSLTRGDSIGVNGVCLTATRAGRRRFRAHVMGETLARSTLGELSRGAAVNLELPARLVDRIGGHLVQGHVDGVAELTRSQDEGDSRRTWWSAGEEVLRYLVRKGSIALDGVSLTVVDVDRAAFEVALIPHTLRATTLGEMRPGARANVEVDVIARYVERLLEAGRGA